MILKQAGVLWKELFFKKEASRASKFIKQQTMAHIFSWKCCEIFISTFLYRTPLVAASVLSKLHLTSLLKGKKILVRDHTFMTSMKNVQFLHPFLHFFVWMGPNWVRPPPPHPWSSQLRLPTTPQPTHPLPPSLLVFLQHINYI